MTHQLIASPYPEGHLVVRPGYDGAIRIGAARYAELRDAPPRATVPPWLADAVRAGWGIDLAGHPAAEMVMVRPETAFGYARASYELNLGCNYDCEHCYLGEKLFAGMDWPGRERLLQVMADAGVLWLQLTGGEPLIDPLFHETHAAAWDMGMMIQIVAEHLLKHLCLHVHDRLGPHQLCPRARHASLISWFDWVPRGHPSGAVASHRY